VCGWVDFFARKCIYERFIGYKAAKDLNAQALLTYLKELLIRCKIDLQNCVAQTYDGANVMSGRLNGVQKLSVMKFQKLCMCIVLIIV
jgi:hypothetical protein